MYGINYHLVVYMLLVLMCSRKNRQFKYLVKAGYT